MGGSTSRPWATKEVPALAQSRCLYRGGAQLARDNRNAKRLSNPNKVRVHCLSNGQSRNVIL
jgi:hypothetical protein